MSVKLLFISEDSWFISIYFLSVTSTHTHKHIYYSIGLSIFNLLLENCKIWVWMVRYLNRRWLILIKKKSGWNGNVEERALNWCKNSQLIKGRAYGGEMRDSSKLNVSNRVKCRFIFERNSHRCDKIHDCKPIHFAFSFRFALMSVSMRVNIVRVSCFWSNENAFLW